MKPEMLVRMANQMADFFASQSHDEAVAGVEDHILKYWDPRMRRDLAAHLAAGGGGLKPIAHAAAERVVARLPAGPAAVVPGAASGAAEH
ncbi:MAG: formate dehydrogenase subunit delta [Dongiaceae bacterium]